MIFVKISYSLILIFQPIEMFKKKIFNTHLNFHNFYLFLFLSFQRIKFRSVFEHRTMEDQIKKKRKESKIHIYELPSISTLLPPIVCLIWKQNNEKITTFFADKYHEKRRSEQTGSKIDVSRRRRNKHARNLFEERRVFARVRGARVRKRTIPRLRVRACVHRNVRSRMRGAGTHTAAKLNDRPTDRKSCEWVASPFTFNRTRWNAHTTLCCALLEVDGHVFRLIRVFLSIPWHEKLFQMKIKRRNVPPFL